MSRVEYDIAQLTIAQQLHKQKSEIPKNTTIITLITSQVSGTVTSIFKCISSNTIKSLRLLKMG